MIKILLECVPKESTDSVCAGFGDYQTGYNACRAEIKRNLEGVEVDEKYIEIESAKIIYNDMLCEHLGIEHCHCLGREIAKVISLSMDKILVKKK